MEVILGAIAILKSLGVETGRIVESLLVFFVSLLVLVIISKKYLWPLITKVVTKFDSIVSSVENMENSVKALNKTLQEHIVQTSISLEAGDERFTKVERQLKEIRTHIGLH